MRRKANPFPLFFAPATADKSLYDWESINYTAANYGEDTAKTFRIEGEQVLLNRGSHLIAARAGWFRQEFVRESYSYIDNTDSVLYRGRELEAPRRPAQPEFPAAVRRGGGTVYQPQSGHPGHRQWRSRLSVHAVEAPRWLSWIGTQRLGAHLERNLNDTEAYTYGQWIADDHAWTNRANRVAVPQVTQRYYSATTRQNIDYGPATLANINGTYT